MINNQDIVCYEFTQTYDRKKWHLGKAESLGLQILINLINKEKYEIKDYIFATEFHEGTEWIHYHGVVTFNKRRDNVRIFRHELKTKFGRNQFDLSRDGKLNNIKKDYNNWLEYITKESTLIISNIKELNKCCLLNNKGKELNKYINNELIKLNKNIKIIKIKNKYPEFIKEEILNKLEKELNDIGGGQPHLTHSGELAIPKESPVQDWLLCEHNSQMKTLAIKAYIQKINSNIIVETKQND